MNSITIDGINYDPFFILDVSHEDSDKNISKAFKKKANRWHPDRIPINERNEINIKKYKQHFRILTECYEYLMCKNDKSYIPGPPNKQVSVPINENIAIKNFNNDNDLNSFNKEFSKSKGDTPNDFGYEAKRMQNIDEYDQFQYKPHQLFNDKNFNPNDFNKAFEYHQEKHGKSLATTDMSIYHQTTDGFNAYNSGDLNGSASVSSYNGLMLVGDTFGQSGLGYSDNNNYSDYKNTFENKAINPNSNLSIPSDFKGQDRFTKPLTATEIKQKMAMRDKAGSDFHHSGGPNKYLKKLQEEEFLKKQQENMLAKIKEDKNLILQYQHMYPSQFIEDAKNNNLETSNNYNENNISQLRLN